MGAWGTVPWCLGPLPGVPGVPPWRKRGGSWLKVCCPLLAMHPCFSHPKLPGCSTGEHSIERWTSTLLLLIIPGIPALVPRVFDLARPKLKDSVPNLTPISQPNEQTLEGWFSSVSNAEFCNKILIFKAFFEIYKIYTPYHRSKFIF